MNHLECVTPKKNKWYWYLLVFFLCFVVSNTVGLIPLYAVLIATLLKNGFDASSVEAAKRMDFNALGLDLNLTFAVTLFAFAVMFLTAILLIKLFHERSWKQVINGTNRVRWSRFFFGLLIWGLISAVLLLISYLSEPEVYHLQFQPVKFFILIVLALLFIPLQSSCEEFLFRGYLTQGIASWTKNRWWAFIIPSLLFGFFHGFNPEITEYGFLVMIVQYLFFGFLLGFMSIMDDGIELAMGVHVVNNLFGSIFINYKGAALQTYALFEITELNPAKEILPLVITGIILLAIFAYKYKWQFSILNKKV